MVEHQRVVIMKVQLGIRCRCGVRWRPLGSGTIVIGAEKPQHRQIIISSLRVSFVPFGICISTASCRQAWIASLYIALFGGGSMKNSESEVIESADQGRWGSR